MENDMVIKRSVPSATSDYRDYYANVRDAILGRATLAVTPEHALDVMRVLEMAQQSSRTRCTIPW
jgi:predicted dehydrogenase